MLQTVRRAALAIGLVLSVISPSVQAQDGSVTPASESAASDTAVEQVGEAEDVTEADVVAACTSEGASEDDCLAALKAYAEYLEEIGVTGAELEDAMIDLVIDMGESVLPEPARVVVAAAVKEIAKTYVTTPERKTALANVAVAIETGEENPTAAVSSPA